MAGGVGTLDALVGWDGCKDLLLVVALQFLHAEGQDAVI